MPSNSSSPSGHLKYISGNDAVAVMADEKAHLSMSAPNLGAGEFPVNIVSGTKNIEQFLKSEKKVLDKYREEPKLLLLGSSDSGKSTLLKQLKIMHGGGFSDKEKKSLAKRIQSDVLFTVCECISELSDFEDKDLKQVG
ncbi:hypothetical protein HDV03_002423 [Kappamyces sp. JEL0829]|nr:hypothetical protein HDV03_002423 [Kappamyces sp. JEL0829]